MKKKTTDLTREELIAAYPELLEALRHINGHWKAAEETGDPAYALDLATCDECKDRVRAILTKYADR